MEAIHVGLPAGDEFYLHSGFGSVNSLGHKEAASHANLCQNVPRIGRIAYQSLAKLAHDDAKIMRFLGTALILKFAKQ